MKPAYWVCLLLSPCLASALAQSPEGPASSPAGQARLFSPSCLAQAKEALIAHAAVHDGLHRQSLPLVTGSVAQELQRSGVFRGHLELSTISPPSGYRLIQLAREAAGDMESACPLSDTYLSFSQGGFSPQQARFYGPLRSKQS
jgi:hypothetical protein